MTLASLERIIGPPTVTPVQPDWNTIATEHGIVFPSDYKALTERYTALDIHEFLFIYHPASASGNLLSGRRPQAEDVNSYLERTQKFAGGYDPETATVIPADPTIRVDYTIYPEPGGLLSWGVTVNAQKCLWLTHENPEMWTVVIGDNVWGWWHYQGSMTRFLVDVLGEKFTCPLLDPFPAEWSITDIYECP
ncbi:hypothetical protein [Actinomadura craniellae]|nr:hypothetical protein [Actinomadura craniellae]